jgi:hypothetical protein
MEGPEESERVGEADGVREPNSVAASSDRDCRFEGVFGKKIEPFDGVPLTGDDVVERAIVGKGAADSLEEDAVSLGSDFVGDREGEEGVCRIATDAGDLGDAEAMRRVRFEGWLGASSSGRSAMGMAAHFSSGCS